MRFTMFIAGMFAAQWGLPQIGYVQAQEVRDGRPTKEETGPHDVVGLIREIRSASDEKLRRSFLRRLEKSAPRTPEDLESLLELAEESAEDFERAEAVSKTLKGLERSDDPKIRSRIAGYLGRGKSRLVLARCASMVGKMRIAEARTALRQIIRKHRSANPEDYQGNVLVAESAKALASVGESTDLDYLVEMLPDDEDTAEGIALFGERGLNAVLKKRPYGYRRVVLEMRDPKALAKLTELLGDSDSALRRVAATALRNYPPHPGLASTLKDRLKVENHDWTREELVLALTVHAGPGAANELVTLVKEEKDFAARVQAIRALGRIGGAEAKNALAEILGDRQYGEFARRALEEIARRETKNP